MIFLLDTDTIIYWIKGNKDISNNILKYGFDNLCCASITRAELYYGAYKSAKVEHNIETIKKLNKKISFLTFTESCEIIYGKQKAALEKQGAIIDDFDLMIAATALANDLIVVTNNTKHFSRIENLTIENWI